MPYSRHAPVNACEWNSAPLSLCRMPGRLANGHWPRQINPTFAQPSCFVVDGVKKTQPHRDAGRRFKGEVKSRDHSSADVDRDRQHRPSNWPPILLVDDDNIDNRVVDLPYRVGTVRDKLAWAWGRRRLQSTLPSSAGRRQRI